MRASSWAMRSLASTSGGHCGRDLDLSAGGVSRAVGDLFASAAAVVLLQREEERSRDMDEGVGLRLTFGFEMEFILAG